MKQKVKDLLEFVEKHTYFQVNNIQRYLDLHSLNESMDTLSEDELTERYNEVKGQYDQFVISHEGRIRKDVAELYNTL